MPNRSTDLRTTAVRWATRVQATHHVRLSFVRGRQFPFAYQKGDQIIYEEVTDRFVRKLSKHLAPNLNVWKRFKGDFMIPFTSGFHGSYGNVHPHVHINLRKPERVSEALGPDIRKQFQFHLVAEAFQHTAPTTRIGRAPAYDRHPAPRAFEQTV